MGGVGGLQGLCHRVHRGRDEIGWVYLLERTPQLCTRWPGLIFPSWWNVKPESSRWHFVCTLWSQPMSTAVHMKPKKNFGDRTLYLNCVQENTTPRCNKDDHWARLANSLETATGTTMTRNLYLKIYPKLFSLSTQTALIQWRKGSLIL